MEKKKVFIVCEQDLIGYPPAISLLNTLLDLNVHPIYVGYYSDKLQKESLKQKGVSFYDTIEYSNNYSLFQKFISIVCFRRQVIDFLNREVKENEQVWLLGGDTICALSRIVKKYNTVLMFYEFIKPVLNFKYKLLFPTYDLAKTMQEAKKVVHCEYNRAQFAMALYDLPICPYVLPNKPYLSNNWRNDIPADIKRKISEINKKIGGRKAIIYQGLFNSTERRLEEFCQALEFLPKDIVFIAMGEGSNYYENLRRKYESDRIIFTPYIRPPYHLLVTELSAIGVMTYFARSKDYADVINPLYCAPNKIFEYSMFAKPMLCNDIPGLHGIFHEFNCGECISQPLTPDKISSSIIRIINKYEKYSEGSKNFYESVDYKSIVNDIISQ